MPTEKDDVLETALRLLLRYGYRNLTMKHVAEACHISRPTLYKLFDNKDAIIAGLIVRQTQQAIEGTEHLTIGGLPLPARLNCFFDQWIVAPTQSAVQSEEGRDLLANVALYVPLAVKDHYAILEQHLAQVIGPVPAGLNVDTTRLAHIMALAAKALKAECQDTGALRSGIHDLISIAVAAVH